MVGCVHHLGNGSAAYMARDNSRVTLQDIAKAQDLDWTLLMITDVLREESVLLTSNYKANRDLPYAKIRDCMYSMPGVMSRKKQLLPTLLSATSAV